MRSKRKIAKVDLPTERVMCPYDPFDMEIKYRVIRFHVKPGQEVTVGSLLCSLAKAHPVLDTNVMPSNDGEEEDDPDPTENVILLESKHDGKVTEILVEENQVFEADTQVILKIEYCEHDVVLGSGLCASCGRLTKPAPILSTETNSTAPVDLLEEDKPSAAAAAAGGKNGIMVNVEGGLKLAVSKQEAVKVSNATVTRLFQSKKLSLVLDLDHTLLHCTDDVRAQKFLRHPHVYPFVLDGKEMYLKPRPGLYHFLTVMKEHFEMHVYTAGNRPYALKACSIIDPKGVFFQDRIVSRDDNPELNANDKRISRLFPVDDSMVAIVDDRRDVWHKGSSDRNLVTCQAFYYFLGMHDVNNSSEPENEPPMVDSQQEEAKDVGLARVEEILLELHHDFYYEGGNTLERQLAGQGKDVKEILKRIHAKVFDHRRFIVFDEQAIREDRLEHLRELAVECGAEIQPRIDDRTTHLITEGESELGMYARQYPTGKIWVVPPPWLEKCSIYWRHVRENSFSLFALSRNLPAEQQQQQPVQEEEEDEVLEALQDDEEEIS